MTSEEALGNFWVRSRGTSVSLVSDYRLGKQATGFQSPVEAKNYFLQPLVVQTSSEAHLATYPMGTEGPFPAGKGRSGPDADYSPHLVPRSRVSRSCTSFSFCRLHDGSVTAFAFWVNPNTSLDTG
jgi:hypothetical protein